MKIPNNSLSSFLKFFRDSLKDIFEERELEANLQEVFYYCFGMSRTDLVLEKNKTFSESEVLTIFRLVKALKTGKPLAYVIQQKEFYGLTLKVDERVLIPRSETEELVEWILKDFHADQEIHILDVGTGSGCIALALKKYLPSAKIFGVDISETALQLAEENAKKLNLDVQFKQVDFLNEEVEGKFDLIVSNPPYISEAEKKSMEANVLDHEPHAALFAKEDPLIFYKRMMEYSQVHLNKNGWIYWEINQFFEKKLMSLVKENAFREVEAKKDINNNYRMMKIQRAIL